MQQPFEKRFNTMLQALHQLKPILVRKMGAEALLFIDENFDKQGFQGETFEPWTKRKDGSAPGRPVLQGKQSTHLKRSPFPTYHSESVTITSSLPYSKIHNEGGDIRHPERQGILNFDATPANGLWRFGKVQTIKQQRGIKAIRRVTYKAHTTRMPKRQYMGHSPVLNNRILAMFKKEIPHIFKVMNNPGPIS